MSHEKKWECEQAIPVARHLYDRLNRVAKEICFAGSLRRQSPLVGDIELLYIPVFVEEDDPDDMFGTKEINLTDREIEAMISERVLEKRLSSSGKQIYGSKNKLLRHMESGIPVDLFAATEECWFNMLVCRTGPSQSNIRLCTEAQKRGLKWNPYGPGFTCQSTGRVIPVESEKEVFDIVGMEFVPPEYR